MGVISRVPRLKTHTRGLITPVITTREPPSSWGFGGTGISEFRLSDCFEVGRMEWYVGIIRLVGPVFPGYLCGSLQGLL